MKNTTLSLLICFALPAIAIADPITVINDSTLAYYNSSIGTSLDGTNPYMSNYLFPLANDFAGDPSFVDTPEPILTTAASSLGDWLTDPTNLNANWSGPQLIPTSWAVNSETAIVYAFGAGAGLSDVVISVGTDNGVFIWLDGIFQYGALEPLSYWPGEYVIDLGNLSAGRHHLQVLREDHGGGTGYTIAVTGNPVPEPTSMLLLGMGIGVLALVARRHRIN